MKQIKELEGKLARLPAGPEAGHERTDLMIELAHRYVNIDSKKALELALESQRLARGTGYDQGLGGGLWIEGLCHFWHGDYTLAVARSQDALKLFEQHRDITGQANAHNVLGSCLLKTGEHAQALIHHLKSLKLWQEASDAHGLATIYNNLGADYTVIADYATALEYFEKSLKLKQEADDQMGEASTLMNIGGIYEYMQNHAMALDYFHQSQKLFEQAGDARQGFALNNIGGIYEKQREFQNALSCYHKSLAVAQQQGYRQAEATILTNIGAVCFNLFQNQKAEEYFRRSLVISEEINEKANIAQNLISLGELYAQARTFQDCIQPLERGLAIAEHIKEGELLARAYRVMFEVHKRWEKYREALDFYEKYVAEEKMIFSDESQRKMQNLQVQCEVSKYQKETEIFRHKNQELERANRELAELNAKIRAADQEKDSLLRQLEDQNVRLEGMVTEDQQTGLYNKRALYDKMKLEIARSRRYQTPLTVAMAEIDAYAEIAGKLSAPKLEQMIKALSRIFRENLRLVDVVGRYGSHTFVFAFPEASRGKALSICERLQKVIVRHEWKQVHPSLALSVSMGLTDDARTDDPDKRILEAKIKLAQAEDKGTGRIAY
jgi:diguanylate cyclase (GGDEF)-like protein